ncbi:MAG TPA: TonB-dependent siderophore receptor [Longimicrobiales bacterium]|nr:TonB-dependent siderophore receptor [Longimicrobiales bacterium]
MRIVLNLNRPGQQRSMRSFYITVAFSAAVAAPGFGQARRDTTAKPVYTLPALEAVGARNRGYSAVRSATSTKTDTPIRDTPQSIGIVTRDLILDQSMQSMADVVRFVPGITMGQGEGHRDAPTIRGNASTADFFIDGVRDDAQYFRDLYNVERVEALKGSNAMIFGRGGGGGVINRVIKEATWSPSRAVTIEGGSFDHKRSMFDLAQPLTDDLAARVNAMYEDSRGFRAQSELHRLAINPTIAYALGDNTTVRASYEFFRDKRTVDRGIPSFSGKPSSAPIDLYFGNPDSSYARAVVHAASTLFERKTASLTIRNRTRFTDYDKFYQNSYASSAVNATGTKVNLSAYAHATPRRNLFNQTDFIVKHGAHTVLLGAELGRQRTDNFRRTGYYGGTTAALAVDVATPTVDNEIEFRQSSTDADNRTFVNIAAAYAQDQIAFSEKLQAIAGVRIDRFAVDYHNDRNGQDLTRIDALISPRAGLVFKPSFNATTYVSYSVSHLPSSGDQFTTLTATTEALEPEQFTNVEVGAKWDLRPNLSLSGALYQLDRTNTTAPDPNNAQLIVQTGSQRTIGVEASVAGDLSRSWHIVAGTGFQRAEITSTTAAAAKGARVALVPAHTYSLWNRYDVTRHLGAGIGIVSQSKVFAAIDNTVTLPGFTRLDGALFVRINSVMNAQINVENLLDARYYPTSQGNNNILPGAPRTLRVSFNTRY